MSELHVVADDRTTWRLYDGQRHEPLSEHSSATEALFTAQVRARDRGGERVVVHDRYHRTHEIHPVPERPSTGAHRARAHLPDATAEPTQPQDPGRAAGPGAGKLNI